MAFIEIPLTEARQGPFVFDIELDGAVYTFDFKFNRREQTWFFDLSDSSGNRLSSSNKAVVNYLLLRTLANREKPQGTMFFSDAREQPQPPGFEDLDEIIFLAYDDSTLDT